MMHFFLMYIIGFDLLRLCVEFLHLPSWGAVCGRLDSDARAASQSGKGRCEPAVFLP